jgi:alpha-ketoglutarate-dependent taurine dioxygenase
MVGATMKIHPTGKFDNHPKPYARILAVPLASAMGAEIQGANLAALDNEQFAEIEDALFRHKMIFFRGQRLTVGDQERFTLRFGELGDDAYTAGVAGHRGVQPLIKEADVRVPMVFGNGWHTDSPFLARPPAISMLYGVDVPPFGGDTLFANTELAYDCLSDAMKAVVALLHVHMSAADVVDVLQRMNPAPLPAHAGGSSMELVPAMKMGSIDLDMETRPMIDGYCHPLVRTHPATGRRALYVDETYSRGIAGMTAAESAPLLGFLREHATQPAFTCRLRWAPGTVAIWDNRSCIHQAFNDFDGYRREMYRTTVCGEVPA